MTTRTLPPDHAARLDRAKVAVEGLSVGDALGETCFEPDNLDAFLDEQRTIAKTPWEYTDDTAMALGILEVLDRHGRIDQDDLARTFGQRWQAAPFRGYGGGAIRLLSQLAVGLDWRRVSVELFGGGSFGNGSAMRVAPVGAYFADDGYAAVAEQAALSAAVTHAHPEGIAGGIAAGVAAAYALRHRDSRTNEAVKRGLFDVVLAHTPAGDVRKGIEHAAILPFDLSVEAVIKLVGNGLKIICQDTVPFCLWAAARHLDDYRAAMLTTIRARGDIDTNAAIVGGIVGLAVGVGGIPADWRADREDLGW